MESPRSAPPACPRCNTPLAAPPPDRPGSWVCAGCAGLWLESDAFARVCAELATGTSPSPALSPRDATAPVPALCPACGSVMRRVDVGGARGVTIDVCRHGTWLDAGELESLTRLGRTEELIRLEVEQRLAPLLKRYRQAPLFASLSVDRGPDPHARSVATEGVRELLHLLAELLRIP